jgi:hypothetical protein
MNETPLIRKVRETFLQTIVALAILGRDLIAEVERSTWQPIETAPKDGTKILLICAEPMTDPTYVVGLWIKDSWHSDWDHTMIGPELEVKHWMPLPAAPEK